MLSKVRFAVVVALVAAALIPQLSRADVDIQSFLQSSSFLQD
ncbi:hypothetical protein [Shewanella gelidii]|nr:hypothetical protein [Shewanella gelidii]